MLLCLIPKGLLLVFYESTVILCVKQVLTHLVALCLTLLFRDRSLFMAGVGAEEKMVG